MSTMTGTSPKNRIGVIVAQNVEQGTMISLPGGRFSAKYIAVIALVPL
jgi:hypothetical protein